MLNRNAKTLKVYSARITNSLNLIFGISMWSCGDSNPGPNKQQKCFLHAYPLIDCRDLTGERHTNQIRIL